MGKNYAGGYLFKWTKKKGVGGFLFVDRSWSKGFAGDCTWCCPIHPSPTPIESKMERCQTIEKVLAVPPVTGK